MMMHPPYLADLPFVIGLSMLRKTSIVIWDVVALA
jgi:hypothetical protein